MDLIRVWYHALPDAGVLWQFDEPPMIVAILLFVGAIVAAVLRAYRRVQEFSAWFARYYEEPQEGGGIPANHTDDERLAFHRLTSSGRSTVLQVAAAGIPMERALRTDVLRALDGNEPYKHVHIEGARKEGKTTLLAQVAVAVWRGGDTLVAYHRSEDEQAWEALDHHQLVNHWRRSEIPFLARYQRPHLLVVADEIIGLDHGQPTEDARQRFFSGLAATASADHRIRVLTASNHSLPLATRSLRLSLRKGEVAALVDHLISHKVIDTEAKLSRGEILARLGGRTRFGESFKALLAAAMRFRTDAATPILRLDDLAQLTQPDVRRAVEIVAACQLLDLELPVSVLTAMVPLPHDQLMLETKAWIRVRPLSFVDSPRTGAALTAPDLALLILQQPHVVQGNLATVLADVVTVALRSAQTDPVNRELVRHILARLIKPRGGFPSGARPEQVAKGLREEFDVLLTSLTDNVRELPELCGWFATLSRFNGDPRPSVLLKRAFAALRGGTAPDCASMTQLISGLKRLRLAVSSDDLTLLDPTSVIGPTALRRETDRRRQNEVITVYSELLLMLGRRQEALDFIERAEAWVTLDAKSLVTKADVQAALSPGSALQTLERALQVAQQQVSESPRALSGVYKALGRFHKKYPGVAGQRTPEPFFESATLFEPAEDSTEYN